MWGRFVAVELKINKIKEIRLYLTFSFFGFKVVNKQTINLFKDSEDFEYLNFIWLH